MSTAAYLPADTSPALDNHSIGAVLLEAARSHGEAPALYWLDADELRQLSYAGLAATATAAAQVLLEHASPGDRVAVWSPNCPEWVVLEYAAALAGLMLTPLNPALADLEVRTLLQQSGARLLFAADSYRGSPLLARGRGLAAGTGLRVRPMTDVRLDAMATAIPADVSAYAPMLLQYTSGTTGHPKGVVLTHTAVFNAAKFSAERLGLGGNDVLLCALPLHHVGGSVCLLLLMLAVGGAVALAPGWDTDLVVNLVARTQTTVLGVVPTMLLDLLDHPGSRDGRLASLRLLQGGGATLAPSLVRRAEETLAANFTVGYGQSEAPVTICSHLEDSPEDKATTIGMPLPHREVRIADIATGSTVSRGEVGELQIRSPLNMTGYWDDPATTRATLDADGWLHTGDLCAMDERGMLSIVGRCRDLIIRGGENIYPSELEDVILAHPSVTDVAVIGAPSERWGEEPVAFVRALPGAEPDLAELDAWVRERVAGYKRPRRWYVVDSFPLTASGKVQKFALRESLLTDAAGS